MRFARFSRVALAAALLLSMIASLAGLAPSARAQSIPHDLAKAAPQSSLLYVDLSLDTASAQWKNATAVLNAINGTSTASVVSMATEDGIAGGKAALVVTNLSAVTSAAGSVSGAVNGALGSSTGSTSGGGLTDILGSLGKGGSANATPTASIGAASAAGVAVIIKPADAAKGWASLQKSFTKDAAAASATPTETTYKTVKINSYAGIGGTAGAAIAQVGGYLVSTETPADIQPIVDVVKGDAKPLSGVANFAKGVAALTGDRFAFGFINGQSFGSNLMTAGGSSVGSFGAAIKTLAGADHDTAFQMSASASGLGLQTVNLPNGSTSAAATAAASGTASALNGATKVPADSLVFINGYNLGKSSVMEALGLAVVSLFSGLSGDTATPTASPTAQDMFKTTAGFLGFNLKADFLDQLTGKYVFALWAKNASSVGAVLASDTANPAALQVTVSGLGFLVQAVGQGKAAVSTVTYGKSALSEVSTGTGGSAIKIDFGVADSQFVLGVGDGAKKYLTGGTSSLADSADYKAAFTGLPTEYDGVAYVNVAGLSGISAASAGSITGGTPVAGMKVAMTGASNVKSFAMVSYKKDGLAYTSSMLVVEKK